MVWHKEEQGESEAGGRKDKLVHFNSICECIPSESKQHSVLGSIFSSRINKYLLSEFSVRDLVSDAQCVGESIWKRSVHLFIICSNEFSSTIEWNLWVLLTDDDACKAYTHVAWLVAQTDWILCAFRRIPLTWLSVKLSNYTHSILVEIFSSLSC